MSLIKYYIIDLETTGLKAGYHEVVQISVIRCEDGFQKSFNIKAEFPNRADANALRITGKTIADIKQGDEKSVAVNDIHNFILEDELSPEHRCMVAHNYSFDQRFSHSLWESLNLEFPSNLWLCTRSFFISLCVNFMLTSFKK